MSLGVGSGVSLLFLRSQKRLCLSEEVLVFLCSSYGLRSAVSLGVGSGVSLRFWSDSGRDRHLKNAVILTPDSIFILCVD